MDLNNFFFILSVDSLCLKKVIFFSTDLDFANKLTDSLAHLNTECLQILSSSESTYVYSSYFQLAALPKLKDQHKTTSWTETRTETTAELQAVTSEPETPPAKYYSVMMW